MEGILLLKTFIWTRRVIGENDAKVTVVGAGLAGSECAFTARFVVFVELIERSQLCLLQRITQTCLLNWYVPTL